MLTSWVTTFGRCWNYPFPWPPFYNRYDDVRSLDFLPDDAVFAFLNGHRAETWGFELSGNLQVLDWWRLGGGYTYLVEDIETRSATTVAAGDRFEALDPNHQLLLQSVMDLPADVQLDVVARYVDSLPARELPTPTPAVPDYFDMDVRLAWQFINFEISFVGKNLMQERHREYSAEVPRNVYGKIAWRF